MPINNLEIKPHFMAVELRKKWKFSETSHFRNSFDVTSSHVCSTFIHLLLHLKDYFISDLKLSRRQSSLSKKKKTRKKNRCIHAKCLQLCQILCDSMDCSPPSSPVHEILHESKNAGLGCHALLQGFNLHL